MLTNVSVRAAGLVLLFSAALIACADPPNPDDVERNRCITLREHLIDLRLASVGPSVDVSAHRTAMQQALGREFVENCRELPEAQVTCELAANDSVKAASCGDASAH